MSCISSSITIETLRDELTDDVFVFAIADDLTKNLPLPPKDSSVTHASI